MRLVLDYPLRPSRLFDLIIRAVSEKKGVAPVKKERTSLPAKPETKLSGHVLVAEDNRINQLYLVELIQYFGCKVDLVENGEEALAAIKRHRYDLVLMDCQMPEMDGLTATAEVRKLEKSGQQTGRVPIVAITANALQGDLERCLEAGMDDYVSKPIESHRLQEVLAKWLKQRLG